MPGMNDGWTIFDPFHNLPKATLEKEGWGEMSPAEQEERGERRGREGERGREQGSYSTSDALLLRTATTSYDVLYSGVSQLKISTLGGRGTLNYTL